MSAYGASLLHQTSTGVIGTALRFSRRAVLFLFAGVLAVSAMAADPKLTLVGGTFATTNAAWQYVPQGAARVIVANDPMAGNMFAKWTVSPVSVTNALGEQFDPLEAATTVTMPAVNVTLTATYAAIPKLTVTGGTLTGSEETSAVAFPGELLFVTAAEPAANKMFVKWTVSPAADLGPDFDAASASAMLFMPAVAVTLTATYADIPKITVVNGTVTVFQSPMTMPYYSTSTNTVATLMPGYTCSVSATAPAEGKMFDKWTVSPASVTNLGAYFNPSNAYSEVSMPDVSVTLTATYADIPKLKVVGGIFHYDAADWSENFVYAGEVLNVMLGSSPQADLLFEKWLVNPTGVDLGYEFNPRKADVQVQMPRTNVTMTAVYLTSTPGMLHVNVRQSVSQSAVSPLSAAVDGKGIFWSVDSVTWTPADSGAYFLKPGKTTVTFKSTDPSWLPPATQVVSIVRGETYDLEAVATYVPLVSWELSADSAEGGGTVTLSPANGQVLPGKAVTLTAKPAANYVFVGWEKTPEIGDGFERSPTLSVAPTSDTVYRARFRAKSECVAPLVEDVPPEARFMVGVAVNATVSVNDDALPVTFTATGLPAGLKIDPVTGIISGVPTTKSTTSAKITAVNAKGSNTSGTCLVTVDALPAWAQGTFDGEVALRFPGMGYEDSAYGLASMTVSPLGKIDGKLTSCGTNYVFSAPSYLPSDSDVDEFATLYVSATATVGKVSIPVNLQMSRAAVTNDERFSGEFVIAQASTPNGAGDVLPSSNIYLSRNIWKDIGMAAVLTNFVGYYTATLPGDGTYGSGYLTLTVDKTGVVKTAGKLADGTSVSMSGSLQVGVYEGDSVPGFFVTLYAAPSAYRGGCLFGYVDFAPTDIGVVLPSYEQLWWENKNPMASQEYGLGFSRTLSVQGGYYNTLMDLRQYYQAGVYVDGVMLPTLETTKRIVEWNAEQTAKVSSTESFEVMADENASVVGLVLSVTPASGIGTGFAAPKADAPLKDRMTGEYDYTVDTTRDGVSNTAGLTFSFNRATGLFKGSFKAWYDYVSMIDNTVNGGTSTRSHTFKTLSFEGALTPLADSEEFGVAGRGFYLWSDKSSYYSGRQDRYGNPIATPYMYNVSYDFKLKSDQP